MTKRKQWIGEKNATYWLWFFEFQSEFSQDQAPLDLKTTCPAFINLVLTSLKMQRREKCCLRDRKVLNFQIRVFKFWIEPA